MPEDVTELPEHGDAAGPADAAGGAGHAASFNALCHHPDLRISRYKLVDMVKVAAPARFLRPPVDDFSRPPFSPPFTPPPLPHNSLQIHTAN